MPGWVHAAMLFWFGGLVCLSECTSYVCLWCHESLLNGLRIAVVHVCPCVLYVSRSCGASVGFMLSCRLYV